MFDCSFIPSYECNLKCWFCMYDCGPDKKEVLDIDKAKYFVNRLDFDKIHMFGFYGGEISINQKLYQQFINLVPLNKPKFTITNGSWSKDKIETRKFLEFAFRNNLMIKVSRTPNHVKYQNKDVIWALNRTHLYNVYLKENDDTQSRLLPMGRLKNRSFSCTRKCTRIPDKNLYRIAMEPNGNVIFQNCDGVYPVVGKWYNSLEEIEKRICNIIEKKEKDIDVWMDKVLEEKD